MRAAALAMLSKMLLPATVGASRLKSPSNIAVTSQPTYFGYVFSARTGLPLPVRNERAEGRGEGLPAADSSAHLQARRPSSPQPSRPSVGGEGEDAGALNTFYIGCFSFNSLAALAVAAALLCCAVAGAAELSGREIQAAQKLYVAKCARCHKFYDPEGYSEAEWDLWMAKMRQKARLKPEQFNVLSAYLATLRSGKTP